MAKIFLPRVIIPNEANEQNGQTAGARKTYRYRKRQGRPLPFSLRYRKEFTFQWIFTSIDFGFSAGFFGICKVRRPALKLASIWFSSTFCGKVKLRLKAP